MLKRFMAMFLWVVFLALVTIVPVRADAAPPEAPPGANLLPGEEITQVRMMAETVTMTLAPDGDSASVEAVFIMHNLGQAAESMQARFPLSFWDNRSDGYFNCPEIQDLRVFVNEQEIPTVRLTGKPREQCDDEPMPWAGFDVTFPPGEDITLKVTYTQRTYGYEPYYVLRYILETGAGWKDTIGSADIIIKMPYEVSPENILLTGSTGYESTTPGATLAEREVRWHFEDLEPTAENNISLLFVAPQNWENVEIARQQVNQFPKDGEIWGRLGLAYKRVIMVRIWLRDDEGAYALYQQASQAYEKAVTLDAKDADWHYGFAQLLWMGYLTYRDSGRLNFDAPSTLQRALEELAATLELKPDHEKARQLIEEIIWQSETYDGGALIQQNEAGGYIFLALTTTPTPQPTATSTPQPTSSPTATHTPDASLTLTAIAAATVDAKAHISTDLPVPPETEAATQPPPETQAAPGEQGRGGGSPLRCLGSSMPLTGLVLLPWVAVGWARRRAPHPADVHSRSIAARRFHEERQTNGKPQ